MRILGGRSAIEAALFGKEAIVGVFLRKRAIVKRGGRFSPRRQSRMLGDAEGYRHYPESPMQ